MGYECPGYQQADHKELCCQQHSSNSQYYLPFLICTNIFKPILNFGALVIDNIFFFESMSESIFLYLALLNESIYTSNLPHIATGSCDAFGKLKLVTKYIIGNILIKQFQINW